MGSKINFYVDRRKKEVFDISFLCHYQNKVQKIYINICMYIHKITLYILLCTYFNFSIVLDEFYVFVRIETNLHSPKPHLLSRLLAAMSPNSPFSR